MAAVKKNLPNLNWGLTAETWGISAKSYTQKADSDVFEHKDEQGEVTGEVLYNFKMEGSISGACVGAPNENVGDAITNLNEVATLGGVTGGTTVIRSVEITKENEGLMEITVTFIRRPTMTIA